MRFDGDEAGGRASLKEEILRRRVEMLREELERIEALLKEEETTEKEGPS